MKRKKIKVILFPDMQVLDVVGPVAVFEAADRALPNGLGYDIEFIAAKVGLTTTSGCISLQSHKAFADIDLADVDTILVPGGSKGTPKAMGDIGLRRIISQANSRGVRIASVCTGSFILAEAGILEGRKCTTHWSEIQRFVTMFPKIKVLKDVVYHTEGHIWTSAGVATGMDMTLAMLSEDHGQSFALEIARDLVLYIARCGDVGQISEFVANQSSIDEKINALIIKIKTSPNGRYDITTMAEQCNMSPRNFSRKFKDIYGKTPAAMVREIRVARAEFHMKDERIDLKRIAQMTGFSSADVMQQAVKAVRQNRCPKP